MYLIHLESMVARTILAAFYGINIKTRNDPYVAVSQTPLTEAAKAQGGIPGLVVCLSLCVPLSYQWHRTID